MDLINYNPSSLLAELGNSNEINIYMERGRGYDAGGFQMLDFFLIFKLFVTRTATSSPL